VSGEGTTGKENLITWLHREDAADRKEVEEVRGLPSPHSFNFKIIPLSERMVVYMFQPCGVSVCTWGCDWLVAVEPLMGTSVANSTQIHD
jgi:hypothetical protein